MPRAKRICGSPGCPNLKPCSAHPVVTFSYGNQWTEYSRAYLKRWPKCVECGQRSVHVDHVIPVKQGGSIWDADNHQPLCKACHNTKTAFEQR